MAFDSPPAAQTARRDHVIWRLRIDWPIPSIECAPITLLLSTDAINVSWRSPVQRISRQRTWGTPSSSDLVKEFEQDRLGFDECVSSVSISIQLPAHLTGPLQSTSSFLVAKEVLLSVIFTIHPTYCFKVLRLPRCGRRTACFSSPIQSSSRSLLLVLVTTSVRFAERLESENSSIHT